MILPLFGSMIAKGVVIRNCTAEFFLLSVTRIRAHVRVVPLFLVLLAK